MREFYANLWPNNIYSVFVRERHISLNPKAINQLFDLRDYNNYIDDFFSFLENLNDETCDKLLREVTTPGTQWTLSKKGNKTCHREFLTGDEKFLFYFIRHSLMPTGHTSSLNVERIVLLTFIVKGLSINIGKLISEQI